MKTLSKELKKTFPDNIKMEVTYTGTKKGSQFKLEIQFQKRTVRYNLSHRLPRE